ncbi:uncharacterized protein Triagg1_1185 [Trichoderma aggressivum f. europaeum]|uniref:Uncharacterized protein n=1 Tax=Trichoderma aggressivum f. europaeum TaxID=173218 RepID=A0AAE1JDB2_9HYPO|nr:hypothetical protein Triagg1_1185 [Trichoderma aggressivum f. europaeum]
MDVARIRNLSVVDYGSLVQLQRPLGKPGGSKVKYSCYISRDNPADVLPPVRLGARGAGARSIFVVEASLDEQLSRKEGIARNSIAPHCLVIDCNGCHLDGFSPLFYYYYFFIFFFFLVPSSLPCHFILATNIGFLSLLSTIATRRLPIHPTTPASGAVPAEPGSSGHSTRPKQYNPLDVITAVLPLCSRPWRNSTLGPAAARPGNEGPAPCLISFRQSPGIVIGRRSPMPSFSGPPCISAPEPNIGSRPKRTRMQQMPPVFFHSSDATLPNLATLPNFAQLPSFQVVEPRDTPNPQKGTKKNTFSINASLP